MWPPSWGSVILPTASYSLLQLVATVRRALDAGLNLIDTAPGYEAGYSEQIVGQALKGYRDGVFVIDKIDYSGPACGPTD